jgi:hypothetical protein
VDVSFSPEALEQLEARRTWWKANRASADLFDIELGVAITTIGDRGASLPVVRNLEGRAIRRWMMPRTRCHLYFEVVASRVIVVSAWGARMGRLPAL